MVCGAVRFCPRSASSRSWMPRARRRTLRPPGRTPLALEAAVDAVGHHRPEPREAGVDLGRGPQRQLVGALQLGDAEAGRLGARQELGGGAEGMRAPAARRRRAAGGRARARSARSRRRSNSRSPAGAGCRPRPRPRARGRWRGRGAPARSRRRGRAPASKASSGRPGGRDAAGRRRCAPAPRRRAAASKSPGSKPARPRITARSVAWPLPVKARLPCSRQPSRAGAPGAGDAVGAGRAARRGSGRRPPSGPWCARRRGRRRP